MILVGNIKHGGPGVYIGRACYGYQGSPLANPFKIGPGMSRAAVIERYRTWLREKTAAGDTAVLAELDRIRALELREGSCTLLCWCKPAACHGDVIRELLAEVPA